MKNKRYFLRLAIMKTMLSGALYLLMPLLAHLYDKAMPDGYEGYTVYGGGILILGNLILLVRAWAFALNKDERKAYLKED